jgi:DNA-binding Lrp family transcriptional regulator
MSDFDEFRAAYVFVVLDRTKRSRTVRKARIDEVRDRLLTVRDVQIVHELLGSYDLICYVEAKDSQSFLETLDADIGALKDEKLVARTETMMILSKEGRQAQVSDEDQPAEISAWILLDTSVGRQELVIEQLLAIPGVVKAHPVLGRYDIVAYVKAGSLEALQQIIDEQIDEIPQIAFPHTHLVLMNLRK